MADLNAPVLLQVPAFAAKKWEAARFPITHRNTKLLLFFSFSAYTILVLHLANVIWGPNLARYQSEIQYTWDDFQRDSNQRLKAMSDSWNAAIDHINGVDRSQEIVDLMTEFYELLAKMGYFNENIIARAPHGDEQTGINVTLARGLGFSERAIDLMQRIPYITLNNDRSGTDELDGGDQHPSNVHPLNWEKGGDGDQEFLLHGIFADMRQDDQLEESQDPLFALYPQEGALQKKEWDEWGGAYMKPDYLCLSLYGTQGTHGAVMILNVRNYELWTIETFDQEPANADPSLSDLPAEISSNPTSLSNFPSRPARLALLDYMSKFYSLEWMPGGLYSNTWEGDSYARLYLENGWPNEFNRQAFMTARLHWEQSDEERYDKERPFEDVEWHSFLVKFAKDDDERIRSKLADLESGGELPAGESNRVEYKQMLLDAIEDYKDSIPKKESGLNGVLAVLKELEKNEPDLCKARRERIQKYGNL